MDRNRCHEFPKNTELIAKGPENCYVFYDSH